MDTEDFDFARLIQPVQADKFFAEYWEQKPLHIKRHDPGYYQNLLTQQDLDHLISNTDMRYPAIKLIQKSNDTPRPTPYYPPEAYTINWKHGSDVFSGIPDVEKVYAEYRAGATINLPGLEQAWRPLWNLCVKLEDYFDHAVRVNGYLTSGNSKGFGLHYDTHEVFVLQIAGKKRWRVYEPPLHLPLVNQPFGAQPFARNYTPAPQPLMEPDMEPGDMLYLPRGYVHAASTSDSFSAHVTIGVTVYTWVSLASEIFMSSMEVPEFRAALPSGFAGREDLKKVLRERVAALIGEFQNNLDYDRAIENFINRVVSVKLRKKGTFHCDASTPP